MTVNYEEFEPAFCALFNDTDTAWEHFDRANKGKANVLEVFSVAFLFCKAASLVRD
jgi:hypothetical protein